MLHRFLSPASPPENVVAIARSLAPCYGVLPQGQPASELPGGEIRTVAEAAMRDLFGIWRLDSQRAGTPSWNPMGDLFPEGAKVLLKPNWVLHFNQSGQDFDCLVTHRNVIEAVLRYVALNKPSHVTIGDAPLQGCDFAALRKACELDAMAERFRSQGMKVEIVDFRRTILAGRKLGDARLEGRRRDISNYVLFDLGKESLLEDLAQDSNKFRVTMYNPDLLQRTHAAGRHQYLVAREVMEAEVVINLPKLKSHKKACITGALKNMVGINGNKEYLPHHRKGGAEDGGDCYAGKSWLKRWAEGLLDVANRRNPGRVQALLACSAEALQRCAGLLEKDDNLEGSWYGNDTVWRMCLDLQRILHYGRADGTMDSTPQRRVVTITDAIIGGEGEGPLASTPVLSSFVTGGLNTAALEWAHARWMGYDPARIPLVQEAFGKFLYPLANFAPSAIVVLTGKGEQRIEEAQPLEGRSFCPPRGWRGHCELRGMDAPAAGQQTVVA